MAASPPAARDDLLAPPAPAVLGDVHGCDTVRRIALQVTPQRGGMMMDMKMNWREPINGIVPALWEYQDARGVTCSGVKVGSTDFGGHDVSEHFRRDTGQLDIVSGARLKSVVCVEPARYAE